jgi:hypothetical protein
MAKMFRPYVPQNVIGDFQANNEFYLDSDKRSLFARMVTRGGKHYFDIKQPDGTSHSYSVDYTIGSKFQQAYATRLPDGQIHVFPVQYSRLRKEWINYWQVIDSPGSDRADLGSWETGRPVLHR